MTSLFQLALTLPGALPCTPTPTPTLSAVSRRQYFTAVAQLGNMDTLFAAVSAEVNSPAWIEFNSTTLIEPGDVLATLTQSVFGWSDAQMAALFQLAATLPGDTSCSSCAPTVMGSQGVSAYDIIILAMKDAGILGIGQTPMAEDMNDALLRLNMMIAQWRVKRWLVWHLVDKSVVSTGAQSYSVGPGGDIDFPVRPDKLESAYFRMLPGSNGTQSVDYPLQILFSREDYSRITLKTLVSFSQCIFYDSAWPMGYIYPWPIPQASLYEVHIVLKNVLSEFADLAMLYKFPPEYLAAIHYNMVIRLRAAYRLPEDPGFTALAADAMETIRTANTQIPSLVMPDNLVRPGVYNIYSDQIR
jgi:hypothetical protein